MKTKKDSVTSFRMDQEEKDMLEEIHLETMIPKSTIIKIAILRIYENRKLLLKTSKVTKV